MRDWFALCSSSCLSLLLLLKKKLCLLHCTDKIGMKCSFLSLAGKGKPPSLSTLPRLLPAPPCPPARLFRLLLAALAISQTTVLPPLSTHLHRSSAGESCTCITAAATQISSHTSCTAHSATCFKLTEFLANEGRILFGIWLSSPLLRWEARLYDALGEADRTVLTCHAVLHGRGCCQQ